MWSPRFWICLFSACVHLARASSLSVVSVDQQNTSLLSGLNHTILLAHKSTGWWFGLGSAGWVFWSWLGLLICLWSATRLARAGYFKLTSTLIAHFHSTYNLSQQASQGSLASIQILSRPRLITGMLSLLPHVVDQSKSQSQQDSEGGKIDSISWWEELENHI